MCQTITAIDDGQQLGGRRGRNSQRRRQSQRGIQIPADHGTRQHAQLTSKLPDQIPDLRAVRLLCCNHYQAAEKDFEQLVSSS